MAIYFLQISSTLRVPKEKITDILFGLMVQLKSSLIIPTGPKENLIFVNVGIPWGIIPLGKKKEKEVAVRMNV